MMNEIRTCWYECTRCWNPTNPPGSDGATYCLTCGHRVIPKVEVASDFLGDEVVASDFLGDEVYGEEDESDYEDYEEAWLAHRLQKSRENAQAWPEWMKRATDYEDYEEEN